MWTDQTRDSTNQRAETSQYENQTSANENGVDRCKTESGKSEPDAGYDQNSYIGTK